MAILLDGTGGVTTPAAVLTTTPLAVTSGGTGGTTKTGTGAVVLGTSPTLTTPTFDSAQLPTISGTAPLYMCRAWVNFNGTGTVAIRASGNVSSITDNGAGDYTLNFTTAMPDANYAVGGIASADLAASLGVVAAPYQTAPSTSALRVNTRTTISLNVADALYVFIQIFR